MCAETGRKMVVDIISRSKYPLPNVLPRSHNFSRVFVHCVMRKTKTGSANSRKKLKNTTAVNKSFLPLSIQHYKYNYNGHKRDSSELRKQCNVVITTITRFWKPLFRAKFPGGPAVLQLNTRYKSRKNRNLQ